MTHSFTPEERRFNAELLAERDRLSAEYDYRPDLYAGLEAAARTAAVEADCRRDLRALRVRQIIEVAVMLLVAAFIGAMLAIGGVL